MGKEKYNKERKKWESRENKREIKIKIERNVKGDKIKRKNIVIK